MSLKSAIRPAESVQNGQPRHVFVVMIRGDLFTCGSLDALEDVRTGLKYDAELLDV